MAIQVNKHYEQASVYVKPFLIKQTSHLSTLAYKVITLALYYIGARVTTLLKLPRVTAG